MVAGHVRNETLAKECIIITFYLDEPAEQALLRREGRRQTGGSASRRYITIKALGALGFTKALGYFGFTKALGYFGVY